MSSREEYQLAEDLKCEFIKLKRVKDTFHITRPEDEKHFLKCAAICIELDVTPGMFLAAQIHYESDKSLRALVPYKLGNMDAIKNCRDYIALDSEIDIVTELTIPGITMIFEAQKMYLRNQIQLGYSIENALLNKEISWEPWFAILITAQPNQNIIDKYKKKLKMNTELKDFLEAQGIFDLTRLE